MIFAMVAITSISILAWMSVWTIQRWRRIVKKKVTTSFDKKIWWGLLILSGLLLLITTIIWFM